MTKTVTLKVRTQLYYVNYFNVLILLDYKHGIRLNTNIDGKVLITFNARNEHDRSKFVEDLREAILEASVHLIKWN